jgi:hypothetical protein
MDGIKIVLLTTSLVLLVNSAPLTESQSSDAGSVFELDESQITEQQREAKLNDE